MQVIYSGGHLAGDILRWPKHPVTLALTQPPCKDYAKAENSQSCQRYFPDLNRLAKIPQKLKITAFGESTQNNFHNKKNFGDQNSANFLQMISNSRKEVDVQML